MHAVNDYNKLLIINNEFDDDEHTIRIMLSELYK